MTQPARNGVFAALLVVALCAATAQGADPAGRLSPRLVARLAQAAPGSPQTVWVFFADKPEHEVDWREAGSRLNGRALSRRSRRGGLRGLDRADLAVSPAYVQAVRDGALRTRHVSRWLNAVSFEANASQIHDLAALPFVARIDVVTAGSRPPEPVGGSARSASRSTSPGRASGLDYGLSYGQLAQIHVPELHDLGLNGAGVLVAVFDTGFDPTHEAFATTPILAARDFVNGDDDVRNGADQGDDGHGTATLSILGAFQPGALIGAAFGATFILAKTENTWSETPVEEDHWVAAAEWAEALGADVISSSLGYLEFDSGTGYSPADMNGMVAVSTRAADLAVERGVVVVNSAGNSGYHAEHNTLGAPADGIRVLAIAAVDPLGGRAAFSSVGPSADGRIKPDLAAQGVAVRLAQSLPFLRFGFGSGTSFSCPLVAGVVALVLQAHPEYTVAQVHQALRSTASQAAAPDPLLGFGLVDALAAVSAPPSEP